MYIRTDISKLAGRTIVKINGGKDSDELVFICSDNTEYKMYHSQECCESVTLDDICGDFSDLVGAPIVQAEEVQGEIPPPDGHVYTPESYTWTFYKLATAKGSVTLRWYGESNGYYSESVDFVQIK